MGTLRNELGRTKPDFTVYVPRRGAGDTGNEHFLVFDGPDGSLMAVWTQSTFEGMPDQHIVFSSSGDEGRTWAEPRILAGPDPASGRGMASWGFPMVSRSGRIYVLYNRHVGVNDYATHITGLMAGIASGDAGHTWSAERVIPMPRSKWDNPDPAVPANWIVWQKPQRLARDRYLAGFTRWVSPSIRPPRPTDSWISDESLVEFMRFENLDDDPEVDGLAVSFLGGGDKALRVPYPGHPAVSVVQEPSLVTLPDGRLFCTLRTATGHPYYTVSDDGGESWRTPEPILRRDGGEAFLHPLSPCPIYRVAEGEYVFLLHNHDGHFGPWGPEDTTWHRRPICVSRGLFRAGARQPVWFSEPAVLMDNAGVPIGHGQGRADLAMYASLTVRGGRTVLWYPERKYFLLGKTLGRDMLDGLAVPAIEGCA